MTKKLHTEEWTGLLEQSGRLKLYMEDFTDEVVAFNDVQEKYIFSQSTRRNIQSSQRNAVVQSLLLARHIPYNQ